MKATMIKQMLSIAAALAVLATTANAGHYLDDNDAIYAGSTTIAFNIPTMVPFNAVYAVYNVQIQGRPAGHRVRVLNLSSTTDTNGVVNNAAQKQKASSNSVGHWIAGDCSAWNMNPGIGSGSGYANSFWIQNYQPFCGWWVDIIDHFKQPGVINSSNCNTVIFFDGIGEPLAAFDPTGWQFPKPSTTPTNFFGHRVDLTNAWTFGGHTIGEINTAIAYSWYGLYKF